METEREKAERELDRMLRADEAELRAAIASGEVERLIAAAGLVANDVDVSELG